MTIFFGHFKNSSVYDRKKQICRSAAYIRHPPQHKIIYRAVLLSHSFFDWSSYMYQITCLLPRNQSNPFLLLNARKLFSTCTTATCSSCARNAFTTLGDVAFVLCGCGSVAILEWKKGRGHCGAKEKSRGANINVKYCWPKVICCMGQSSELEREIKQKTGGQAGGAAKYLGGHGPPGPPLRIATAVDVHARIVIILLDFCWPFLQMVSNNGPVNHAHTLLVVARTLSLTLE